MIQRDPLTAPRVGDRVPYVMIQGDKKARGFEKSEDPIYAMNHDLPIDTNHYLDRLKKAVERVMECVLSPEQLNQLWTGEHTRKVKKITGSASFGGIMKFAVVKSCCLVCKTVLNKDKGGKGGLCGNCQSYRSELCFEAMDKVKKADKLEHALWTQCQTCQGSRFVPILCNNRDCPIFYARNKATKNAKEAREKVKVLDF
jgi:DNA polymerase delta subunit 1